jgi:hypothetical protein
MDLFFFLWVVSKVCLARGPFWWNGTSNKFVYMHGKGESEMYVTDTLGAATDPESNLDSTTTNDSTSQI